MSPEEKNNRLDQWQNRINNLPYASTIPYPYCCLCFERLTHENIYVTKDKDGKEYLVDVCLECKDEEDFK